MGLFFLAFIAAEGAVVAYIIIGTMPKKPKQEKKKDK